MPIYERIPLLGKISPLGQNRQVGVLAGLVSNKDCFPDLALSNRCCDRVHLAHLKLSSISLPAISNPLLKCEIFFGE